MLSFGIVAVAKLRNCVVAGQEARRARTIPVKLAVSFHEHGIEWAVMASHIELKDRGSGRLGVDERIRRHRMAPTCRDQPYLPRALGGLLRSEVIIFPGLPSEDDYEIDIPC